MPRKLFDIEINEITLCKSPANRKKFFIKKMEDSMKEFIEELKKFMAEDDEDIENALTKDEIAKAEKIGEKEMKALKEALGIVSQYEDIPDDLEKAILTLVAKASYDYPVVEEEIGKAGAKLSKTTQAQIKMALDHIKDGPKAIDILKTLLGIETKKAVKKEGDEENLSAETIERLERLEEFEKKEKEDLSKEAEKKQEEKVLEVVNKALKDAGLEEIAQKTSIAGQEEDDKDKKEKETKKGADDDEDKFPSIPIPVLGD